MLDRCRIRWGCVVSVQGDAVKVRSRPLEWDGLGLSLGDPQPETARPGPGVPVGVGDVVALHWDWICHRLDPYGAAVLRHYTMSQLAAVNRVSHPAPVLDRGSGMRAVP